MDLGLRDRACIVTGASRGIGQAAAASLVAEGAHVLVVGRDQPALTAAAEACLSGTPPSAPADAAEHGRGPGRAETLALDVTDADAGERLVAACLKELSLSRAFADIYASRGVLVNAVAPGPINTELWLAPGGLADQPAEAKGVSRDEALAATAARQPVGRLGTAQEVAAAIVFLCSEAASNVAGSAWSVDGGAVPVII